MEYYSAIKTNGMPIHSTTWIDFEDIMPSKMNPVTKEPKVYDSTYGNCAEQAILQRQTGD